MTRQKVKMTFIPNESARKSTFKKRRKGLFKKAYELATLCDVQICAVVNSEYDSSPEFWPSREGANKVASQWEMMSVMDKTKKMVNQETFIEQRISKATESLKKVRKENKELEMKNIMSDCLRGKISVSTIEKSDLRDLGGVIDQHIKDITRMMEIRKKNGESSSSLVPVADAATTSNVLVPMVENLEMGSSSVAFHDMLRDRIQSNLNMKHHPNTGLDLNKKQW